MPKNISISVLTDGIKDLTLVKEWGTYLATNDIKNQVSTSQIRKIFGSIKQIQAGFEKSKGEIILLEPKLAYAVGRDYDKKSNTNKTKIKEFYELLSPLIREINEDKTRFQNFVNVLESIVAYHKAAGGQ
ncbi:CRISPR type III-A-associated protein Csm2 [Dyadobacter jejuensis]|uniref:CRISPR system Cms protein Csm2 n=1 Tax=Dyadobacter jejuensis TaxID=1082580 RepID=A0A316B5B3_9BACT|nr:type III-A CRISPR-associated protein Csm2 [Dyadobacter jejuensis]PWJ57827.1 CRISPR type III-A-associated protein Csm2 [Dyadobacter jejuensis]